jgi:hypothetical protein
MWTGFDHRVGGKQAYVYKVYTGSHKTSIASTITHYYRG